MPRETTKMEKCGPVSVGMVTLDVSDVIHVNPLAIIGRWLGGCGICGKLSSPSGWVQCLENYGRICKACDEEYVTGPRGIDEDGCEFHYCLSNPQHPYHWPHPNERDGYVRARGWKYPLTPAQYEILSMRFPKPESPNGPSS